jgi:hypothetical protein
MWRERPGRVGLLPDDTGEVDVTEDGPGDRFGAALVRVLNAGADAHRRKTLPVILARC